MNEKPTYDREKMLRLVDQDNFLRFTWNRRPVKDDAHLRAMFHSYVLDDAVMIAAYEAA